MAKEVMPWPFLPFITYERFDAAAVQFFGQAFGHDIPQRMNRAGLAPGAGLAVDHAFVQKDRALNGLDNVEEIYA